MICLAKKKKKTNLIWIILGIITLVGIIGTITYFAWPKKETEKESKEPVNLEEKIQQLRSELISLRSKLNNISDTTKKTRLESKLANFENQIKNLSNQDNSLWQSIIQQLEHDVKEVKKQIENGDNKNEAKVKFAGKSSKDQNSGDFDSYKFLEWGTQGIENIFYISKNHSRIKELLNQNKLQKDKKFTVRYGKVDGKSDSGLLFTFNENNQELEIIEVGSPSPQPNPDPDPSPQPDSKGFEFVATKINDNTYKYHITLDGGRVDFSDFIELLKRPKKDFFQAFQGALKDANSKFPAYFWKCIPVSKNTLDKSFEFVVIKSDSLANITQNYISYKKYLLSAAGLGLSHVSFDSSSGNTLVIPALKTKDNSELDYKNISQFTKNAPDEQQRALWKEVADSLMKELEKDENAPRWLNTEGTGVYYLHVRIDKTSGFYSNYPEYAK